MPEQATVLLVDDEPDLLELAQLYLEDEGFVVIPARNGERALRLLARIRPDVILTDMMMPVLDGFGFIQAYRRLPGPHAPVIASSSMRAYLEEARKLGVSAVLEKPYDLSLLGEVVRTVCAGKARMPLPGPTPEDEIEATRLRMIFDLGLDHPAPEAGLQAFLDQVAAHFQVPIALLSVITDDRQFWTAGCGIPRDLEEERGGPRRDSFCTHAVVARSALIVQDTVANPFFRDNVFVTQRGIRFYAGVPLIGRHGEAIGTLCLLDYAPHTFTYYDLELLSVMGRVVLASLEWRERQDGAEIPESAFRYLDFLDRELDILGKEAFLELTCAEGCRAAEQKRVLSCAVLAVPARRLPAVVEQLRQSAPAGFIGRLGHSRLGWLVPSVPLDQTRARAEAIGGPFSFAVVAEVAGYAREVQVALNDLELSLGDAGLA